MPSPGRVDISALFERGWQVVPMRGVEPEQHPAVLDLARANCSLSRKTYISSAPFSGELSAQAGDFWFHSDGCFLTRPPRFICILVVEAGGGGALSILDRRDILSAWPDGENTAACRIMFGSRGSGVLAPIWSSTSGVFRYRRDYMSSEHCEPRACRAISEAEAAVLAAESRSTIVGMVPPGDALFVDNWRFLHRRQEFAGLRRICRLWFDQAR